MKTLTRMEIRKEKVALVSQAVVGGQRALYSAFYNLHFASRNNNSAKLQNRTRPL